MAIRKETIKSLVFQYIERTKGVVDYDELTALVKERFPESKWKSTHWSFIGTKSLVTRLPMISPRKSRKTLPLLSGQETQKTQKRRRSATRSLKKSGICLTRIPAMIPRFVSV